MLKAIPAIPKPVNDVDGPDAIAASKQSSNATPTLYSIRTHRRTWRAKLRQKFIAQVEHAELRVEGRDIDFDYVRSVRRNETVTVIGLETASLQVKHRKIKGFIRFTVDGIDGPQKLKWNKVDDLQRMEDRPAFSPLP